MTTTGSHTLPDGSMPIGGMKEELSKSYIHMLASSAGLDLGAWGQDYDGIDATLRSSVDYTPNRYGPKIDVQLKCTGQEKVSRPDTIAWSLQTRTIEKLAKTNRGTPSMFCVLVTAVEYWDWIHLDDLGLMAKSHMYWLWGHDLPPLKADQLEQVVHLPKTNILTPASILNLMEEASRWTPSGI